MATTYSSFHGPAIRVAVGVAVFETLRIADAMEKNAVKE